MSTSAILRSNVGHETECEPFGLDLEGFGPGFRSGAGSRPCLGHDSPPCVGVSSGHCRCPIAMPAASSNGHVEDDVCLLKKRIFANELERGICTGILAIAKPPPLGESV